MISELILDKLELDIINAVSISVENGWNRNSLGDIDGDLSIRRSGTFRASHGYPLICLAAFDKNIRFSDDIEGDFPDEDLATPENKMMVAVQYAYGISQYSIFCAGIEYSFSNLTCDRLDDINNIIMFDEYMPCTQTHLDDFNQGLFFGNKLRAIIGVSR